MLVYKSYKELPGYDQLGQVRWLIHTIRDIYKWTWILEKFCIANEMMVRYKGTYCPLQQYMLQKPQNEALRSRTLLAP